MLKIYAIDMSLFCLHRSGHGGRARRRAVSDDESMRFDVCLVCHEKQYEAIRSTAHWMTGDGRAPVSVHQCASCHGNLEEHVENEGKVPPAA